MIKFIQKLVKGFIASNWGNILLNIDNTDNLLTGQVCRALILLHSLSAQNLIITNNHLEKLSSRLILMIHYHD